MAEPVVTRDEVTATFFVISDISENVKRIVELLEEDESGEEEDEEDTR